VPPGFPKEWCRKDAIAPSPAQPENRRHRRLATPRRVVSIGAVVAIIGLVLAAFAGGGGRTQAAGGTTAAGAAAPTTSAVAQPVDPSAKQSCADFDAATARLAVKDTKGFIDNMTNAATAAQDAAGRDGQWQLLVGNFAAFATDLSANDATSVFSDLTAINQQCAAVRGERQLVLNASAAPSAPTTTRP
jgi:hypothetical protein